MHSSPVLISLCLCSFYPVLISQLKKEKEESRHCSVCHYYYSVAVAGYFFSPWKRAKMTELKAQGSGVKIPDHPRRHRIHFGMRSSARDGQNATLQYRPYTSENRSGMEVFGSKFSADSFFCPFSFFFFFSKMWLSLVRSHIAALSCYRVQSLNKKAKGNIT